MTHRWAVHIGVEKSGTTTLQRSLFPAHPQISFVGKPFADGPWPDNPESNRAATLFAKVILNVWTQDSLTYDAKEMRTHATEALKACDLRPEMLSVIAEEALSTARAVDRTLIADRLGALLGDAKILITVRNQPDALMSLYAHLARKGTLTDSFDTWVAKRIRSAASGDFVSSAEIQTYRYDTLIELYVDRFGRENVGVFLFEDLRDAPDQFARDVAAFLGIDATQAVTALGTEWHNKRKSDLYYSVRGAENRYARIRERFFPGFSLSRHAPAVWRLKEKLRTSAMNRASGKQRSQKPPAPETMELIEDFFRDDNQRLEKMLGRTLPVKGYGKSTSLQTKHPEGKTMVPREKKNV